MVLSDRIELLKGMGPKTAEIFKTHGITTIEDFIYFLPRGWINASYVTPLAEMRLEMAGLIDVQVVTVEYGRSIKNRKPYLKARVADATGSIDIIWFYATYLRTKVKPGARFLLYGRVRAWGRDSKAIISPRFITKPCIIPVYPELGGLSSTKVGALMLRLKPLMVGVSDHLPSSVCNGRNLASLSQALVGMHFPNELADIEAAKKRLGFDELLMLVVPSLMGKRQREQEITEALPIQNSNIQTWIESLPFPLTGDQTKVTNEVLGDMSKTKPMNRLVQGDVGSGKTVVGLAAAYDAVLNGKQAVWLAPTELLAQQHFETAKKLLATTNVTIGLWTRTNHLVSDKQESKPARQDEVMQQSLIIGTHAVLSEKITIPHLGLLVIDEQHRFGVKQRAQLRTFGDHPVHLLSMTATPIPRTMALLLYGDLSLSVIKEKPADRKPVLTKVVKEENRKKAYEFIDQLIAKGQQAFVVCPMIQPVEDEEANVMNQLFEVIEERKSVLTWFEHIKKEFPFRRVGMLHGKLKAKEKEEVMEQFRDGNLDILVSTTVIEVGVDVPNATIMIIESAERFGLAQLHQLRGRVGRGSSQAFCLLFPSSPKKLDNERLQMMADSNDGFELAEKDLELRGPGELTGLAQSGVPPLKFASLGDTKEIEAVRTVAETLLGNPEFEQSFERFWRIHHPE